MLTERRNHNLSRFETLIELSNKSLLRLYVKLTLKQGIRVNLPSIQLTYCELLLPTLCCVPKSICIFAWHLHRCIHVSYYSNQNRKQMYMYIPVFGTRLRYLMYNRILISVQLTFNSTNALKIRLKANKNKRLGLYCTMDSGF